METLVTPEEMARILAPDGKIPRLSDAIIGRILDGATSLSKDGVTYRVRSPRLAGAAAASVPSDAGQRLAAAVLRAAAEQSHDLTD
jgi:hypothetical protein